MRLVPSEVTEAPLKPAPLTRLFMIETAVFMSDCSWLADVPGGDRLQGHRGAAGDVETAADLEPLVPAPGLEQGPGQDAEYEDEDQRDQRQE